jgi:hypothetical protein
LNFQLHNQELLIYLTELNDFFDSLKVQSENAKHSMHCKAVGQDRRDTFIDDFSR